jgi:hypothetical protein
MYKLLVLLWGFIILASCVHRSILEDKTMIQNVTDVFYEDGGSFALFAELNGAPVYIVCHRAMTKENSDILRDGRITISSKEEDLDVLYNKGEKLTPSEEKKLKKLLYQYLQANPKTPSRDGIEMMIEVIELPENVRNSGKKVMLKNGFSF